MIEPIASQTDSSDEFGPNVTTVTFGTSSQIILAPEEFLMPDELF
jgi:hypothetical protein